MKTFGHGCYKVKCSRTSATPEEDVAEGGAEVGEGYMGRQEML